MSAVEHALLAVMAADSGDTANAQGHIYRAQEQTRAMARRERQVVEIATLVVASNRSRAAGLALQHLTEFPADAERLARVAPGYRLGLDIARAGLDVGSGGRSSRR